ncbi:MAG: hypothetical protein SOV58_05090 [Candidatus Enteromonas sp.]|nr:hypothetical protein [Candidatus Enteromonas sp.]
MTYREIINSIEPFDSEQTDRVSSNEKLGAYTALYLKEHGVPLTFNYLCVAMYKMYPHVFYCDDDFKEYPSIDRLNRTLMHMTITKNKNDAILVGSAKMGYELTKVGEFTANQTHDALTGKIAGTTPKKRAASVDSHKEGPMKEYNDLKSSQQYRDFESSKKISSFTIWRLYKVTPFTQEGMIREKLKLAEIRAKELKDEMVLSFIQALYSQIN